MDKFCKEIKVGDFVLYHTNDNRLPKVLRAKVTQFLESAGSTNPKNGFDLLEIELLGSTGWAPVKNSSVEVVSPEEAMLWILES